MHQMSSTCICVLRKRVLYDVEAARALHQLHSLCQQVPQTDRSFISAITVGECVKWLCARVHVGCDRAKAFFCFV